MFTVLCPILSQIYPVYNFPPYPFMISFNIIISFTYSSYSRRYPSDVKHFVSYLFVFSMRAICSGHLVHLIIFVEDYTWWDS